MTQTALDFTVKGINGNDVDLNQYLGKVVLIVNVASKCGFTPQYKGLQELYEQQKENGFVILGFPANNFLWQEPGDNDKIKSFCTLNYGVTFPMFSKISVKGKKQAPLYEYLTNKKLHGKKTSKVSWNFNKFLIDKKGQLVAHFGSKIKPEDKSLNRMIKTLINENLEEEEEEEEKEKEENEKEEK
ncbi:thioredoxin/glutathione peroxidase btue [Anaeramoeba flamelloides]|uniref:Glutathione peroxidase n=1 Tax=Anaeramoeba flamelloides TaxID=1746091 RepID=A0AAV7YW79_9EUKA|nr:thioredoxin/glutathione peroxidase btue [Anaeramoeba flamelloides]